METRKPVTVRMSETERDVIQRAADMSGRTLPEFMRDVAIAAALGFQVRLPMSRTEVNHGDNRRNGALSDVRGSAGKA